MSDPGVSSGVPAPPAAQPDPRPEIPMWVIIGCVVVMLAGAGLVAFVLLNSAKEQDERTYPSAWDPRVAPYVKIVEKQRGLTFMHPVEVRFLPAAQFEKTVRADEKDLDADDRLEIEQATGLLRALGLITGDVDLFAAFNDAHGSGTLAYYSFEDERVTIRGTRLTPAVRPTLVHELTHALQDQHFKIGQRQKELRKESEDGATTTEQEVFDALVEGDAQRVASRYRDSLGPRQRRALAAAEARQGHQGNDTLKHVPKVVLTMISAPYTLGEAMVRAVAADGGNAAVDRLFRETPTHDAVLLDPLEILSNDTRAAKVAVPGLEDGEDEFDSGEFGAQTWYFMLAERLPLQQALAAVDGWGGDAYVAFDRDGTSCARVAYTGDSPQDTSRMLHALQAWIAAAPGSSATARRAGGLVRFQSCDPGTESTVGKDASVGALRLATTRAAFGAGLLEAGAPTKVARCVAGRVATEFSSAQLADPGFFSGATFKSRVQQLVAGCR